MDKLEYNFRLENIRIAIKINRRGRIKGNKKKAI